MSVPCTMGHSVSNAHWHSSMSTRCIDWTYTQGLLDALDYDPDTQNPFLRISLGTLFLFHDIVCYKDYLSQLGNFRLREGNRDHYTDTRTSFEGKNSPNTSNAFTCTLPVS
jgi:hypothetical protein